MAKKDKDPVLDEYHKLKREIIRNKVNIIIEFLIDEMDEELNSQSIEF
jgi:hypothetical protein